MDANLWLAGIVTLLARRAAWVLGNAASLGSVGRMACSVPIGRPFPDISNHIVDAITIRRKRFDRRGALITIELQVLARKIALPRVSHLSAFRRQLIAPRELRAIEAASRSELPFGLSRQLFAGPLCVSFGITISNVYDGMIVQDP